MKNVLRVSLPLLFSVLAFGASAPMTFAATPMYVNPAGDNSDGLSEATAFHTIEQGITAVDDGGTVNVAPGAYEEQVTIHKSLNLIGAGEAATTIIVPTSRTGLVTQGTTVHDYGLAAYALSGTIDVRVEGFTIDVNGQNKKSGAGQMDGVFFRDVRDVGGTVAGLFSSTIHNFAATPAYEGFGVVVYDDSLLTIHNNDISDYTRDGLLVGGGNVTISTNTITGSATPLNGINVKDASAGSITDNTVTGHTRSEPWAAGGIVAWASNGLTISGNHVNGNFYGIDLESNSQGITISGNDLTDNIKRGISLTGANDTIVSGNTIVGPANGTDDVAIGLASGSSGNTIGGNTPSNGNTITMATSGTGGNLYAVHMQGDAGANNTIRYNTITGGQRAVQFDGPPGITGLTTVSNNTISNQAFSGISASNNGDLTITDNTLTNTVRPMDFFGPHTLTITGNTIDGSTYDGINLGSASGAIHISGNHIYNVAADNTYAIHARAGADNVMVDNNEIYNSFIGVWIDTGSTGDQITNNDLHNNTYGAMSIHENVDTITGNTLTNNQRGIETDHSVTVQNNSIVADASANYCQVCLYAGGMTYHASKNWWGTAVSSQIFGHEYSWIADNGFAVDYAPYYISSTGALDGTGVLNTTPPTAVYVDAAYTDGSAGGYSFGYNATTTIQAGINAVASGGTVHVAAGTYPESVTINKSLTLSGAMANAVTAGRTAAGTGESTLSGTLTVNADSVNVNGFTLTNPAGTYGVLINEHTPSHTGISLTYNILNAIGGSGQVKGIYLVHGPDNVTIAHNLFSNISAIGTKSADAIFVGDSNSTDPSTGVVIQDNVFNSISSAAKGAYGILVNNGAGTGVQILNNVFSGLSGGWTHAVGLEGPTSGATVTGNSFSNLTAGSADNIAVFFEANSVGGTVTLSHNTFNSPTFYGVAVHPTDISAHNYTVAASQNWWGSDTGPADGTVGNNVTASPWCVTDACAILSAAPSAPSLHAITSPTHSVRPTLAWDVVTAAPAVTGYHLEITKPDTTTTVIDQSGTSFTSGSDLSEGAYTWKVRAHNAMGDGSYSTSGNFTIDTTSLAPAGLTVGSPTLTTLALSWTNNEANGSYYTIKRSMSPITADNFAAATMLGSAPTVASGAQGYIAKNLTSGTTYYFAIKMTDAIGNVSPISTVANGTTSSASVPPPADAAAPAAISGLSATPGTTATSQIVLHWTATGDDGTTGIANKYIIKRSSSAITADNFGAATTVFNSLSPQAPGSAETFTVTGLTAGTTYYFAIKAADEAGNLSPVSADTSLTTGVNLPTIDSVSPTTGQNNGTVSMTITGTNFIVGSNTVRFSSGSNVFDLVGTAANTTSMTLSVPVGVSGGIYGIKIVNDNGTSAIKNSAYTVTVPATPPPSVSDITPATIGTNDTNVSITITGTDFAGATAVTIDGMSLTDLTVSNTKITGTLSGIAVEDSYDVLVATPHGTNGMSSVKLNVKAPVQINVDTVQDQTTTQPIDMGDTSTTPVQITLQSDDTVVNTDTVGKIEVVLPPATVITDANGDAYHGNINPPQFVKPTEEITAEAGADAVVITMGNPEEKITFSNNFVVTITLDSANSTAPLIWYYNPVSGLEIAGIDGEKDGVIYAKGGTVLNTVSNNGTYTYTIGLLLNHMSSYVAGVTPTISSFSPTTATAGASVVINGTNFSPSATVKFSTSLATVMANTTTQITVSVPSIGVGSYTITVTNADALSATSPMDFVVKAVSGSGGGGNYYLTPAPIALAAPVVSVTSAIPATPTISAQGQVLGAATYNFTKTLAVGSRGADVTALQQFLSDNKFYTGPITGYFGQLTKKAVTVFQKAHRIAQTGTAGPLTRAELSKGVIATTPENASDSRFTPLQVDSIITVLQAFGVDDAMMLKVRTALGK